MEAHLLNGTHGRAPKLHFNLKQMKQEDKPTQIMLTTTVAGQRIRIYTKMRIEPRYWDKNTYRCRTNEILLSKRECKRLQQVNRQLDLISRSVLDMDRQLARQGKWLSGTVIRRIVQEHHQPETPTTLPIAYLHTQVKEYLKGMNRRGKRGIASTQKTYTTAIHRLENYCREQKIQLKSFDDFDKQFFSGFANYLYTCTYPKGTERVHYTQNTVINTLKVIKNLLHRTYDNEMTNNNYYQRVQTALSADVSERVYLQEPEIRKLARMPTERPDETCIRDMFVIACYTALRISDMQRLGEAVIQNGIITLYQAKTQEKVQIPVLKEIAPLIEHYRTHGFPKLCANKANETIKELARRCGLVDVVNYKEHRGGSTTICTQPKWKLISFHTARRSCITNLYKRGYPINYIMSLSGHRSPQAFQRYMRATNKELMNSFVSLLKKDKAI